jgi:hypothetical protein
MRGLLLSVMTAGMICFPITLVLGQSPFNEHYLIGSEGIEAGSLPAPGIYIDDVNLYEHLHVADNFDDLRTSSYIIAPRARWLSGETFLGASYGVELMLPIICQDATLQRQFFGQSGTFSLSQWEAADLEISPFLLSWHLKHFDIRVGYSFWVPTGDNTLTIVQSSGFLAGGGSNRLNCTGGST